MRGSVWVARPVSMRPAKRASAFCWAAWIVRSYRWWLDSKGIGALAGVLVRRSGSALGAHKMAMFLCGLCALPACFAASVHAYWPCVCIIALAAGAHQGFSANLFVVPADLFPQAEVATVAGLAGTAGAIGGVAFSASAGEVLQHVHSYVPLFLFAGTMYWVALLAFHLLQGKPSSEIHN